MQALHQRLYKEDAGPKGKDDTLFIHSGATNVGMHMIQLAQLEHRSCCTIALASLQHHARLLKLGVSYIFDY